MCHESWIVCAKWHEETRMVHPFLVCVFAFDPRQEPSAVVPLAGICAGGRPQGRSLPATMGFRLEFAVGGSHVAAADRDVDDEGPCRLL